MKLSITANALKKARASLSLLKTKYVDLHKSEKEEHQQLQYNYKIERRTSIYF